ncbi:MAG: peptide chain release factor 1 [Candidatus Margulisiibacteriota bacterium]|nr:MAG: peptide chain release factor 1 [Candidatus Margulisbacteria bacterium GWD2_39_127]OGI02786.1 MAG: peptide chain release factor 1 [Candidatus Margulisbacteria bacterium GWF2_38_17]OGI09327.1 MAG: peptide chain release factor 1 [Candidatus Margulisbacteria bacterium GWE2_39_32]PZM77459.1 MAG: peptide chain release factor 1 [Candidatus Margulisiibacteriota bacterium]HAR63978.1 peptide chain release factor 1 [Candidatus Margulisiibacteriota bacterium]
MFRKLEDIEIKYDEIERLLGSPDVLSDQKKYAEYSKQYSDLKETIVKYREYKTIKKQMDEASEILTESNDRDMIELAQEEFQTSKEHLEKIQDELKLLLLPRDPNDNKNAYLEIRSGTGGEEASLFTRDLLNMYSRYIEKKGWQVELIEQTESDMGGLSKVILLVKGDSVYGKLKYESGTHRVQRVPETEASGRIHTSAVTVAVLPEVEDVDIQINPNDLRIDTYRASGAGGQHINKTDSAVRVTHIPTGVAVACQDGRSQHQNKDKAMHLLKAKIFESQVEQQNKEISSTRKLLVGSGDRSEKIRTYNFPQGRVTDHRIGLTLYKLNDILTGDIDEIIEALLAVDRLEKMKTE